MKCQEVEMLLYDRLTGRAEQGVCRAMDTHLQGCPRCQAAFEEMQRTVSQLDTWTVPEPSADFPDRLKARVTAHLKASTTRAETTPEQVSSSKIPESRPERKGLASLLRRQWFPVVGLAFAATLAGVVVFYQGFGPDERQPEQMTRGMTRGFQLDLTGNPIVIETPDPDRTFDDVVMIIRSQGGELVRSQPVDTGLELTVKIAPQAEQEFIGELKSLGRASIPKEGYRDGEGNLLVLLKKAGTFVPQPSPDEVNGEGGSE